MYQPAHGRFAVADPASLLERLSDAVPATLVTAGPNGMRTTILPMLFEPADGELGMLRGHLARGNPHWREVAEDGSTAAIAIFNGPDAYVSPAWYEEKRRTGKVVPTWNYTSVVVHGRLATRHEPEWLIPHVRRLVDRHEADRPDSWSLDDAPVDYVAVQAKAIVGLELRIERIDGKRKLTQNRSREDFDGVVAGLSDGSATERAVAPRCAWRSRRADAPRVTKQQSGGARDRARRNPPGSTMVPRRTCHD